MAGTWFLLATFSLCCVAVYCDINSPELIASSYDIRLKSIVDILWKTYTADIARQENVAFFSIPLLADLTFIYDVSDEATKRQISNRTAGFNLNVSDLAEKVDAELRRTFPTELKVKTIFYDNMGTVKERKLSAAVADKLSLRNNRFKLISVNFTESRYSLRDLLLAIETDPIGETCEVRYCSVQAIIATRPPLAIITLAKWTVASLEEFEWRAPVQFIFPDKSYTQVRAVQGLAQFDHAEFTYSKDCIGRVLHVPYRSDFYLIFVVPSGNDVCLYSPQLLWESLENVNFDDLPFQRDIMYVSIPLFKISANIDVGDRIINGTAFADAFEQPAQSFYNGLVFQAAEVDFNPQVSEDLSTTITFDDAATFDVRSPFYFAVFHESRSTPVVAGIVNNPRCSSKCAAQRP